MINPGYTRIEEVIYKLKDKYSLSIDFSSAKELVWDIIGVVFSEDVLEDRIREINISSYQGVLPEDFYNGTGMMIREKKTGYPLTESTDSFLYYGGNSNTSGGSDGVLIVYGESVNLPEKIDDGFLLTTHVYGKKEGSDEYIDKTNKSFHKENPIADMVKDVSDETSKEEAKSSTDAAFNPFDISNFIKK